MTAPWRALLKPLALGAGLTLALLALVWNGAPPLARAAGPTCTVCPAGSGSCDYAAIQAAVDDPGCTEIKVAQGVYTGVQGRPVPAGYDSPPASGLITQVVYISRTVTVRGGYTTTNWTVPYPLTQSTTLDAGGLGRVLVIAGDVSPMLEGLGLTGGNSADLGSYAEADAGGGGYIISATATLSACRVFGNAAGYFGGGLLLRHSPATLSANSVVSNSARYGGGLYLEDSPAALISNSVTSNTASWGGGGLFLSNSPAALSANRVSANTASSLGGGLFLDSSPATLSANRVTANTANVGGGLYLKSSAATLSANSVTANTAGYGGGLYLDRSDATLTNTVVADNRAGTSGSGLYIDGAWTRLVHTTIAHNTGDGSGVYVTGPSGSESTVWLTNTILVSHTVGITVDMGSPPGNAVTMNRTLWYSNTANWGGVGALTHTGDYSGPPAFADAGHGNYHIGFGSAAVDRGVDAGVTTDKDGRPRDAQPDLGAYEIPGGPTCTVCLDGSCDYTAIQPAVDNAACTEIKVAQGIYTGIQGRPVPAGYFNPPASGLITQVVYISRTVTVRGGYTTTNWTTPDFIGQPTTLDAGKLGRALVVAGAISPTIEGLGLTNGRAAGLGGAWADGGGGGYVLSATATLSACRVFSNAASYGGGLLVWNSSATLSANRVTSNTAATSGGGLLLNQSSATLISNSVTSNTAASNGGGVGLWYSAATLSANDVTANTASGTGGGLYLEGSAATLISNSVSANTAGGGGGLYLTYSPATLSANRVTSNSAATYGGGLYLWYSPATLSANRVASNTVTDNTSGGGGLYLYESDATFSADDVTANTARTGGGLYLDGSDATLTNTVVADNRAGTSGSGLYIGASSPRLLHTTIARNTGGDGSGLNVANSSTAWLTNTILASQTTGIRVAAGSAATVNSTLWASNTTNWSGAGTLNHSGDTTGDPAFADAGGGDYHIGLGSAAVDRGVDAGVTTDKDGGPRDAPPDLGAYELPAPTGPTCTVCLDGSCYYTAIQPAVDNAACLEIKVAQGVYTGVQGRPVPAGYDSPPASGLITQVVYISRTVTVRGGYTPTNWTTPDFIGQPTTLDAGGLGRALVVAGDVSPTIEGLGLTNGSAAGLGGFGGVDGGGGGYLLSATATLSACRVFDNAATFGGGLLLNQSSATLISNSVTANSASSLGGGLLLNQSGATLISNSVTANTAYDYGGGLYLYYSDATLISNSVTANTAYGSGGGLYLNFYSDATLINTVVAGNWVGSIGSGLYIGASSPRLLHTTIARNTGGDGSGVYVDTIGEASTAWLTNTILVSQTTGIIVAEGSTAALNSTLWYGNGANWGGAGALAHSGDITGAPAFVDAAGGDYHINSGSAAVDRGVDAGVPADKDGRPRDARPDLGAYEAAAPTGPGCTVCLDGSCDYASIQPAVDNLHCIEIKVAQGMYSGVQGRPVPAGYDSPPASGLITQVVYISRTVTVRGGYTTTNWTTPDFIGQPTTLDAGGLGRALVVAGDVSPTLEGLGLTNGSAAGLGGLGGTDGGGGGYLLSATATLSACRVFDNAAGNAGGGLLLVHSPAALISSSVTSNTAVVGGGLYLYDSAATLSANRVAANTAADGGGLYLENSAAALISNTVAANTASNLGGGLYLTYSPATLSGNDVTANSGGNGGGLYLIFSSATLSANRVTANTSGCWGGGLYLVAGAATLSANDVLSNTADCLGGGLYLQSSLATLVNTIVADNRATYNGSGLYLDGGSEPRLLHTTIARNGGGDGSGLYVDTIGGASTVWLTDTILASQGVGIVVAEGSTAIVSDTLWYGNGANWGGAGALTHSGDITGDPAFVDPNGGDYHIGPASAAVDRGVDAGVAADKDGRPRDARPDLGAYELAALRVTKSVDRDPAPPGTPLTYTVRTTSTLDAPLAVMAFDVLPDQVGCPACGLTAADLPPGVLDLLGSVSPTATVAYSTTTIAPGATWVWLIPNLSVQADYTGTLTNSVVITSAEGVHALYVLTSTAGLPAAGDTHTYLPVIMKGAR